MRFVVRFTIAIATLLSSAILCWGQAPMGIMSGGAMGSQHGSWDDGQVSLTPPDSVEGTWVADDDETPMQPPEELGLEPFQIDQSMAGAACDGDGCDCEEGCGPYFDPRAARKARRQGWFAPLWCSDLWNEVHAHRRTYVEVDYLSMWMKGNDLPPLVTTSPLGTPQSQAGVLPESATTAILFGNGRVDTGQRNGARINVGYWLVDGEFLGIEGQYFALQSGSTTFDRTSDFTGDPNSEILARPFINVGPGVVTPTNDAAIIAFPDGFVVGGGAGTGTLDGSVNIRTTSNLQSAGALLRKLVWIDFTMQRRVDLLLGYRFFRLGDSVTINDYSSYVPTSGAIPAFQIASQDQFSARNLFNGGEIGLKAQSHHGRLSLELIAKCAFGNNQQLTYINGYNTVTSGGTTTTTAGGLLAQPTNMGNHERNVFAILPEADVNLRWDITCNLRATIGYTFLYINRVQRSGNAIDLDVNPTQIQGGTLVGQPAPIFSPYDDTWWAHAATAGVEYRW